LLTASMHAVSKGDKELETVNYYDENQALIRIALDPLLTPSENAQRYFKKYTKMKNSQAIVEEQMEQTRQEIVYLGGLLQQLGTASLQDIQEIRDELAEQGYLKDRSKKQRKKKKQDKPALSCFTSSDGTPIYVGKNNKQNEHLTNRVASSGDTWLHTKDIPGSHVVIRSDRFSDETLLEAAQLAAYFSQAKESSQVPVDYTLIKHVHKPSGAKPGFVIYVNQKTLFVTPDEQRIKQMQVTMK
jgi:predicted ribosome quality control (RQC) complex YloA/Tae2 family protein